MTNSDSTLTYDEVAREATRILRKYIKPASLNRPYSELYQQPKPNDPNLGAMLLDIA